MLDWQIELGATEAIGDVPVNRYDLADTVATAAAKQAKVEKEGDTKAADVDPVAEAEAAANASRTLPELQAALGAFEHCSLKKGARNLVFSDGTAGASVMIVGEAPGRDEDRQGRPFVGRAGQLLDRMLEAIGLDRRSEEAPVYITNVLPWRPPQNRDPSPEEITMMRPFLMRHIALANPQIIVVMGNISAQTLLGKKGITRLRGQWDQVADRPALPMFHPAYLLRNSSAKKAAWEDLLALRAALDKPTFSNDAVKR